MKQLLAVLLALVLALSCTLAMAETVEATDAQAFPGMTIESECDVDRDTLKDVLTKMGMDETMITLFDTIAAIADQTGEKVVIAKDGFQAEVLMKGNSLLNLVGLTDDKGVTLGSNLIPNYALSISYEELGKIISSAVEDAIKKAKEQDPTQYLDMEAISKALTTYVNEYTNAVSTAIVPGEAQQGNYEIDGVTYNTMLPMKVDLPTIVEASNELISNLQNDEAIQTALVQLALMGVKVDFNALDESYTDADPATLPAVNVEVYMNVDENGNPKKPTQTAVFVTVVPAGETIPATVVSVKINGDNVIVDAEFWSGEYTSTDPEDPNNKPALSAIFNMDRDPKDVFGTNWRLDVYAGEFYCGCAAVTSSTDESIRYDSYVYLQDAEKPIVTESGSIVMNGALTLGVADNVTKVTLSELTGENAGDVLGGLMSDLSGGALSILMTAYNSVPEVGAIVGQLMSAFSGASSETEPAA